MRERRREEGRLTLRLVKFRVLTPREEKAGEREDRLEMVGGERELREERGRAEEEESFRSADFFFSARNFNFQGLLL